MEKIEGVECKERYAYDQSTDIFDWFKSNRRFYTVLAF